jgi:hypothetical protein
MTDESNMDEEPADNPEKDPLDDYLRELEDAETAHGRRKTVDEFGVEIYRNWRGTMKAFWKCSCRCAEAYRVLDEGEKRLLLERLPFDRSTFSKLVKIGNDDRLRPLLKRLPLSYSTIYEVSLLSDEQLERANETGIINPDARRSDIEALRKGPRKPNGNGTSKDSPGPVGPRSAQPTANPPPTKTPRPNHRLRNPMKTSAMSTMGVAIAPGPALSCFLLDVFFRPISNVSTWCGSGVDPEGIACLGCKGSALNRAGCM